MILRLSQVLSTEVIHALRAAGFDIVRVGDCPWWMEKVESIPAPVYRMKQLED